MTKHTATSTVQGGRRTRKSKKGGSALTPAPVQAGGADLAPASFKGGSDKKIYGGNNHEKVMGGNNHESKKEMSGGEDMVEEKHNENTTTLGGKKSGAACGKAYCVKCRRKNMAMINCKNVTSKNGRSMLKGNCKKCGTKMNKFT
jgi:hypothetical protein